MKTEKLDDSSHVPVKTPKALRKLEESLNAKNPEPSTSKSALLQEEKRKKK